MTQVGESVSPVVTAESDHDNDCYFCKADQEPAEEENTLDDDPDDDSGFPGLVEEGVKFKNDASALGSALGKTPGKRSLSLNGDSFDSSVAAHHLIPGNAALKNSKFFLEKKYLWTGGKRKGNIGYNVNSEPNGQWLPGNYAQRPWGKDGAAFAKQTRLTPADYAFASIKKWRAQFHDAHKDYSEHVRLALDAVFNKLNRNESIVCPKAAKKKKGNPEEQSPMYSLVARFHTISGRMKRKLVFPPENWYRNIFTSRFSLQYMNEISPPKKRKRA